MNNYPTRQQQTSDLQQYTYNQYEQPRVSFFDGVKRLGWVIVALAVWGIAGLFISAYQNNTDKWDTLIFCVAVVAFVFLLIFFAAMLAQIFAERAGVSLIKKAEFEPVPVRSEWDHEQDDNEQILEIGENLIEHLGQHFTWNLFAKKAGLGSGGEQIKRLKSIMKGAGYDITTTPPTLLD